MHRHSTEIVLRADALIFGRVVCEMMESAWRLPDGGSDQAERSWV